MKTDRPTSQSDRLRRLAKIEVIAAEAEFRAAMDRLRAAAATLRQIENERAP